MINYNLNLALYSIIYALIAVEFVILLIRAHRIKLYGVCKLWILFSAFIIIGNLLATLQFYFIPLSELKNIDDKEEFLKAIIHSSAVNSLPSLIFWHNGIPYFPLQDWRVLSAKEREEFEIKRTTWQQTCISCVVMNLFAMAIALIALKTKVKYI